jgi:hypothetical protein
MIQKILIIVTLIGLMFAAYRIGYGAAERSRRDEDRFRYAAEMSIMTHLYLAAERGQTERLQESLGMEVHCATLFYESRVPKSERDLLSPDYAAAKQISVKVQGLLGTNGWTRGKDGFWQVVTN